MAQATAEVFEFPAGGIADFYMEDHEIEALEREEAAQEFGSSGIATFEPIATRMASYGRYGDDTVAHVETGELIVPKALIDDNPKLRDSIFSHLRDLGVEDPERYVVGSGVNSINPDTGMPEFFLKRIFKGVKKAGSKLVKGVSKALKGVTNVIKKAAPVIIPFALNAMFPGLGAIYSGALGAGIGTLVQGGSLKDAFKNALIGGAIGGATAAIGGGLQAAKTPGGSFSQGAMKGIQDAAKLSNLQTAGQQLTSGQFGKAGYEKVLADQAALGDQMFAGLADAPLTPAEEVAKATDFGAGQGPYDPNLSSAGTDVKFIEGTNIPDRGVSVAELQNQMNAPRPEGLIDASLNTSATTAPTQPAFDLSKAVDLPTKPPGFFESVKGALTPGDNIGFLEGMGDAFLPSGPSITPTELMAKNPGMSLEMAKQAIADATPTLTRALLPAGTVGTAATVYGLDKVLGGDDDGPSDEELLEQLGPTGYELYKANQAKYGVAGSTPMLSQGQYVVPTIFPKQASILPVADGGEIFPRRVGGIMPDEGTPGKDSVKAMLMPGEFVMTTNAVKGLGDGDNDKGINRMYDMMRSLEAKGKAMA